jgi:photosystem II stability/assembly factor-like uncharacterized protein
MGVRGWGLVGAVLLAALALLAGCDTPPLTPTAVPIPSPPPLTATPVPIVSPTVVSPTAIPQPNWTPVPPIEQILVIPTRLPTPIEEQPQLKPPPLVQVESLAFLDEAHGWLMGTSCENGPRSAGGTCRFTVQATQDGGHTWRELPPPDFQAGQTVCCLQLLNLTDGWAYGTSLFSTHDGGQTWKDESIRGSIQQLFMTGNTFWMFGQLCSAAEQEPCSYKVLVSRDQGKTWQPTAAQPSAPWPRGQLVAVGANDAWLLYSGSTDGIGNGATLFVTHDRGTHWQEQPTPPCARHNSSFMAGLASGELWYMCAGQPATDMQLKHLYVSPDGGVHWNLVAEASLEGLNNLYATGHVKELAVPTSGDGWVLHNRGTLDHSTDGGYTWKAAIPYGVANPGDASYGPLVYTDNQHLWVAAQNRIFHTSDGGLSWEELPVSPPWYPPGLR